MNRLGVFFLVIIVGSLSALAVTWGIEKNRENKQLMESLPAFTGATLVREWTVEDGGNDKLVREYATSLALPEVATDVTSFYSTYLTSQAWVEEQARAAASYFTRGSDSVVLGRVGPELMEAPADAQVSLQNEVPADSQFFFTLEVAAERTIAGRKLWR